VPRQGYNDRDARRRSLRLAFVAGCVMHTTSPSLLERLRQSSNTDAWDRFAELYTPLLYYWARRAGLPEQDAGDLVQDVFVILIQKLPEFVYDGQKSFRSWLRTVTMNLWRNRLRGAARRKADPLGSSDAWTPAESDDFEATEYRAHLVARAMTLMQNEFEPNTWQACWQHVVLGRPAAVIAAELGVREGTVYSAKCRVLQRLREELDGLWE
jgi:RNA polymerase sigma-70 factor (ECF subfamily)